MTKPIPFAKEKRYVRKLQKEIASLRKQTNFECRKLHPEEAQILQQRTIKIVRHLEDEIINVRRFMPPHIETLAGNITLLKPLLTMIDPYEKI